MRKAYLFVYDDDVGTRDEVKNVIESMSRVWTWRFDMPHTFYVISDYSAQKLYEQFRVKNGKKGRFMFIEAGGNRQGLMISETWYLLRNKRHKPKDS